MTNRKKPEDGAENPALVRAFHEAFEKSLPPTESVQHRLAVQGRDYHIGSRFTITTAQGSAYFYIDNSMGDVPFAIVTDDIKVSGGNALVYVRDEPDLDLGTFQSFEFKNVRSDVTPGPGQDAYFGYDNDVTINDKGRLFDENFIKASQGSPGQTQTGAGKNGGVSYIIGPGSTGFLEIENNSSNEIEVSISAQFHETPPVPDIVVD